MGRRVLDINPTNGIITYHSYDHSTKTTTLERVQNVEPILDQTKQHRNDDDYTAKGIKNEMWHYASIPAIIIEKWLKEGVDVFNKDHEKEVFKRLNSPQWKYLKNTTKVHRPK